jgi:hypothetical protein
MSSTTYPKYTLNLAPNQSMGFSVDAPFEAEHKLRQQLAAAEPKPQTKSRVAGISESIGKLGKLNSYFYLIP